MLSLLSFRKASVQLLEPNPAGAVAAIYEVREFAAAGGLMSYATSLTEAYHQVGRYAGRILKDDAQHVFAAVKQKCNVFLTCDRDIRECAAAIKDRFELIVHKPSDFVASQGW